MVPTGEPSQPSRSDGSPQNDEAQPIAAEDRRSGVQLPYEARKGGPEKITTGSERQLMRAGLA